MAAVQDPTQNLEIYSSSLPYLSCIAERQSQCKVLQDDASRLFSGHDDVEVWVYHHTQEGIVKPFRKKDLSLRRTGIVRKLESIDVLKPVGV